MRYGFGPWLAFVIVRDQEDDQESDYTVMTIYSWVKSYSITSDKGQLDSNIGQNTISITYYITLALLLSSDNSSNVTIHINDSNSIYNSD